MLPEDSDLILWVKLNRKEQAEEENLFVLLKLKTEQFSAWVTFLCMSSSAHINLVIETFFAVLNVACSSHSVSLLTSLVYLNSTCLF